MIEAANEFLRRRKVRKLAERDTSEKKAIARAFNDRYTYRKVLIEGMSFLPGSSYGGPHRSGYAWMCPDCNRTHHPASDSVFSGLQYPACCQYPAGHRVSYGIRSS